MKRIISLVSVAFCMVAMMALAGPTLASDGGATVEKYGPCGTGVDNPDSGECLLVMTPSGTENLQVHAHPQQPGPATGGGATHEVTVCITPQPGKAVITPSGNANVHCTGQP